MSRSRTTRTTSVIVGTKKRGKKYRRILWLSRVDPSLSVGEDSVREMWSRIVLVGSPTYGVEVITEIDRHGPSIIFDTEYATSRGTTDLEFTS